MRVSALPNCDQWTESKTRDAGTSMECANGRKTMDNGHATESDRVMPLAADTLKGHQRKEERKKGREIEERQQQLLSMAQ